MREKMITRTVTATVVTVMAVEMATAKAFTTQFTLTGNFKDNADILKAIKKNDTDEIVYAAIVSMETKETLYGAYQHNILCFSQWRLQMSSMTARHKS